MDVQGPQFSQKSKLPQDQKKPKTDALPFSQSLKHAAETAIQVFAPEESQKQRFKEKKTASDPLSTLTEEEKEAAESVYKTVEEIKKKIRNLVALEQKHLGL